MYFHNNNIQGHSYTTFTEYPPFYIEMLEVHNEYRAMHGVGQLVLDNKVSNNLFHLFLVQFVNIIVITK